MEYLYKKRVTEKERMEHGGFARADMEGAEKIRNAYRKASRGAKLYFLRCFVKDEDWEEAHRPVSKVITTTAQDSVPLNLLTDGKSENEGGAS